MNELELGLSESLLEERCKTLMFSLELVVSLKLYPHWQTLNLYYKLCSLVYLGRLQVASIEICMLAWNCRDTQVTILGSEPVVSTIHATVGCKAHSTFTAGTTTVVIRSATDPRSTFAEYCRTNISPLNRIGRGIWIRCRAVVAHCKTQSLG